MQRKFPALVLSLLLGLAIVPMAFADDPPPAGDQQAGAGQGGKQGGGRRLGHRLRNRLGGMRHRRHKKQDASGAQNGAQTAPPQSN